MIGIYIIKTGVFIFYKSMSSGDWGWSWMICFVSQGIKSTCGFDYHCFHSVDADRWWEISRIKVCWRYRSSIYSPPHYYYWLSYSSHGVVYLISWAGHHPSDSCALHVVLSIIHKEKRWYLPRVHVERPLGPPFPAKVPRYDQSVILKHEAIRSNYYCAALIQHLLNELSSAHYFQYLQY